MEATSTTGDENNLWTKSPRAQLPAAKLKKSDSFLTSDIQFSTYFAVVSQILGKQMFYLQIKLMFLLKMVHYILNFSTPLLSTVNYNCM